MFVITATIRDLAIIFLALESIVVLALLGILIWQIWRLTKMVQTEVGPIVRDTQDTLSTVRGTTEFVGENMVTPIMRANTRVAAFRRTVQVLAADLPFQRSKKPSAPAAPPAAPAAVSVTPTAPPPTNGSTSSTP